jgi:hypothetical protein
MAEGARSQTTTILQQSQLQLKQENGQKKC